MAWLSKAVIQPIHRTPTLNDIFTRLTGVKYLILIDASSWYHNLKPNEKSLFSNIFLSIWQVSVYITLPFGTAPAGNMFNKTIDESFNDIANVFGIADDILIAGFDVCGSDHDEKLEQVLYRCIQVNLRLNKEKCLYRWTCIPFCGKVISRCGLSPDPAKVKALMDMLPSKMKREQHLFLGIVNYLSTFSPTVGEVCEPLQKLTSFKAEWTWKRAYQEIYKRAKTLIKEDTCMKYHNVRKPQYLETWCIRSRPRCCTVAGKG